MWLLPPTLLLGVVVEIIPGVSVAGMLAVLGGVDVERVVATMVSMAMDVLEDKADRSSCNAPSQGHRSILLEEDLVNYFSGSSDSGDSVELVGIEKGTYGTVSAGGIVDGYSYFGNEPNPDP